ncbi:MAG: helix-turn-helix domain-containing protein [Bacteroidia bacterium]
MGIKEIGKAIKSRRMELGITQTHLSDITRVGINTISIIEQGEGNPTLEVLIKILGVLGLQISLNPKSDRTI